MEPNHRRNRRRATLTASLALTALLATGGASWAYTSHVAQERAGEVAHAQEQVAEHHEDLLAQSQGAESTLALAIADGERVLAASEAQVSDETVRERLSGLLAEATALADQETVPTQVTWVLHEEPITSTLFLTPSAAHLRTSADTLTGATAEVTAAQSQWAHDQASAALEAASTALAASDGKVLDETTRTRLTEIVRVATRGAADQTTPVPDLLAQRDTVAAATGAVTEAQAAWQAEQDRIAAEAAAAAERARQRAATPTRSTSTGSGAASSPSGGSSERSGRSWTLNASNCADAYEAQGCVDSTSISYIDFSPWGGPRWVGGHRSGAAGSILDFRVGDTVTVVGSGAAGTYEVTGESWIPKATGQKASSLGGGFAFQTCSATQMRIVWAKRV